MKKKITLQGIYIAFLCVHLVLLIVAGVTIREDKFRLRAETPYIEIEPDSHEILSDGTQRYTLSCESDGKDYYLLFYTNHRRFMSMRITN